MAVLVCRRSRILGCASVFSCIAIVLFAVVVIASATMVPTVSCFVPSLRLSSLESSTSTGSSSWWTQRSYRERRMRREPFVLAQSPVKRSTTSIGMSQGHEGSARNSTTTNASTKEDLDFQRRNKLWVVLVDDEESIRFSVGDFLYDRGYEVTACSDSKSLLDLIVSKNKDSTDEETKHRLPDLVISDVRMPESDKNGYELVQFLRSADTSIEGSILNQRSLVSLQNVPIVLLTAKAMTDDRIMGYESGADVVLPKPFSPEELVSIIDSLILRRQQRLKPKEAPQSSLSSQDDIRILKRELAEIKAVVKQNAATMVQKTDIVLSDKERVIVELLSKGYTPREIASEVLKPKSSSNNAEKQQVDREEATIIRKTIDALIQRTETESKTELIRWAHRVGYIRE